MVGNVNCEKVNILRYEQTLMQTSSDHIIDFTAQNVNMF